MSSHSWNTLSEVRLSCRMVTYTAPQGKRHIQSTQLLLFVNKGLESWEIYASLYKQAFFFIQVPGMITKTHEYCRNQRSTVLTTRGKVGNPERFSKSTFLHILNWCRGILYKILCEINEDRSKGLPLQLDLLFKSLKLMAKITLFLYEKKYEIFSFCENK